MTEQDQPTSPGAAFWAARGVRIEPETVEGAQQQPDAAPEPSAPVPAPAPMPAQAPEAFADLPSQRGVAADPAAPAPVIPAPSPAPEPFAPSAPRSAPRSPPSRPGS